MKIRYLASAAAAVLALGAAAPALAQGGYADVSFLDQEGGDFANGVALSGAWAGSVGGFGLQVDAEGGRFDTDLDDDDEFVGAAVHAYTGDTTRFGGYLAAGETFDVGSWEIGAEIFGALSDNWNGTVRVAYVDVQDYPSFSGAPPVFGFNDLDGFALGVGLTMFPSDNVLIGFEGDILNLESSDDTAYSARAKFEWAPGFFPDPLSLFGSYAFRDSDIVGPAAEQSARLGLRWSFGTGSVRERETTGPGLRTGTTLNSIFAR